MSNRIILHIDMNSYFASVEQQANPLLRGRPVGVCEHLGGIIIAPSVEAKRLGIALGTPVWEAVKIFPQIALLPTDPDKYRHVTQKFLRILWDYSDSVEQYSIDEAFVDITVYCAGNYDDAFLLGLEIKQRLRLEIGEWVSASIGIGPNKLIAKIAADLDGGAICHPERSEGSRFFGLRPQNDNSFLDRICIVKPEQTLELYNCLQLTDVPGIGSRMSRALQKLGIFTLRELADYPLSNLLNQFGLWGLVLHDLANFQDTSAVMTEEEPAKSFGHAHTVSRPLSGIREIRKLMFKLSEKVGRRMRQHGAAGSVVHYFHSGPSVIARDEAISFSRQRKIRDFINDGKDIFRVAWGIYRQAPDTSVKIMGVSVSGLKFDDTQEYLFEQYQRPARLTRAMDKINDKYGEYTIIRALMSNAPEIWAKDTVGFGRTRSNPR